MGDLIDLAACRRVAYDPVETDGDTVRWFPENLGERKKMLPGNFYPLPRQLLFSTHFLDFLNTAVGGGDASSISTQSRRLISTRLQIDEKAPSHVTRTLPPCWSLELDSESSL